MESINQQRAEVVEDGGPGAPMASPIFIVGANRSGTTLLRLILNAHSRIAIPDELIYFHSDMAGIPIEQWRRPGLSPDAYARFVDRFLKSNCEPLKELDVMQLKHEILEKGPADLKHPYQVALEAWARYHGKQRWGEKTPGNLFYADVILEMFPDAKFIHLVRDPRAGVYSMMGFIFLPDDVVFNALNRHKHMTVGRAILEQNVPPAQRMTVRYEDLVTDPSSTVQAICAFLEEPFEPEMLSFHNEASRSMDPLAVSDFNTAATQPITASFVDKWRTKLSADAIATVEKICAPEMKEFGYEPVNYPLRLRPRLNILIKIMYWHVQCWRHRNIRHYTIQYEMLARSRSRLENLRKMLGVKSRLVMRIKG